MDKSRYLGALLLAPLIIFIFLGGVYLKYGVMILSLLGLYEYFKVIKEKDIKPISIVGYILCIIYYIYLGNNINYEVILLVIIASVFFMLCIPIFNTKYNLIDIATTLLGIIYIPIFFSFIVLVNLKESGQYLVWLIFISSWLCDITAYYIGKYFGHAKLCPEISPNKTVEGSIGGLLGSIIACTLFGFLINKYAFVNIALYHFIIIGALCGMFCQLGDLSASSIKRFTNVKDYSKLIPGHGGILDRFDSILFASVIVYYYITFILGM